MFKPIRFNNLLKAVPGLNHLQHTPNSKTHAYAHLTKTMDVDKTQISPTTGKATHVQAHVTEKIDIRGGKDAIKGHPTREDISVTEVKTTAAGTTLSRVHTTIAGVAEIELTPPHPPREETPIYARTHHHLVFTLDSPCAICGVRQSTLNDPKHNLFGAQDIETHHYPIERCLLDACDPKKVGVIFPQVKDRATLEAFIDSEDNMMVLCDIHHRHPFYGIHHLVGPDFCVQPFLYGGYQIVTDQAHAASVMANDEKIVRKHMTNEELTHGTVGTTIKVQEERSITRKTRS